MVKRFKLFEVLPDGKLGTIYFPDYVFDTKGVNERKPGWGPFACFGSLEEVRYFLGCNPRIRRKRLTLRMVEGIPSKEDYCYTLASIASGNGLGVKDCKLFSVDHALDNFKIISKEIPYMHVSELFSTLAGRFATVFYRLPSGETKRYNGQVEPKPANPTVADRSRYVTLRVNRKSDGEKTYRTLKLENVRLVKANHVEYFIGQGGILEAVIK